jgi:hypothetical protein
MSKWRVLKLVRTNGKAPYDKWASKLTIAEKAKVDDAIALIESVTQIPPEKVKKYNDLYEIKIYGNKTALRPFAIKDGEGRLIVLLVGCTKKGTIPAHIYKAALKLAEAYRSGDCATKGYWED